MSQLLQRFAATLPQDISSAYIFNGIDQYMQIPAWVPLGLPFIVNIEVHPLTINTATPTVLYSSDTLATRLLFTDNGLATELDYDTVTGTNVEIALPTDIVNDVTYRFNWLASGSTTTLNNDGTESVQQGNISASIAQEGITTFAANGTTFDNLFRGAISGITLTDGSPIQDTWTTASDGVRVCTINNEISIPLQSLFTFSISFIAGPDPLTGFVDLVGHDTLLNAVRIYGSTHATFPNQIGLIDSVGNEFRYSGYDRISPGQHVRFSANNNKTGTIIFTIDSIVVPLLAAPLTTEDLNVNSIGGTFSAGPLPTGWTVHDFFLQDVNTGREWIYLLNEETGDIANNSGNTDGNDFYDAVWTDALGKIFIPTNSRFYDFTEGAGGIVRNLLDPTNGTDGVIVNFDNDNWFTAALYVHVNGVAPEGVSQGLPYDYEGSVKREHLAVDIDNPIDHYSQGLPMTANSRLAVSFNQPVERVGNGAAPFDINGRLSMTTARGSIYNGGVPYDPDSRVSVVPDPPLGPTVYDPLELDPDWSVIAGGGVTSSWYSTHDGNLITVFVGGTTSPETAYAWRTVNLLDVEISSNIQLNSTTSTTASMLGAVRIVDVNNYIGWRTYLGVTSVVEHIAGVFTTITTGGGDFPQAAIGSEVRMRVNGTVLEMTINGIVYPADAPLALNVAGRVGLIARSWTAGEQDVFTNFNTYETYDPIEESPNWTLFAIPSSTWQSVISLNDGVETVTIVNSSADSAISFGALSAADVEISCNLLFNSLNSQTGSFLGAVRIKDSGTFIGWRSYNGWTSVQERLNGFFTSFTYNGGDFPQGAIGSEVKMRVVGAVVTMTINGVEYVADQAATVLAAGVVGAIPRQWGAGRTVAFDSFAAAEWIPPPP